MSETARMAFAAALERAGVESSGSRGRSDTAPLILCFNRPAAELYSRVADEALGASNRVLVVALDQESELQVSWPLLRHGAEDVVVWRGADESACAIASRLQRWRVVDDMVASELVRENLVGRSRRWRQTVREIVELALFSDAPILLRGETGTGKELVARLIHTLDTRPGKRDVVLVDCTTLVPELSGSELFGHERGAFTGAVAARDGACALADGGTLFLDEIGELPLSLQAELLRVVQEGSYKRVGSNTWRQTRFRLICATHRDLAGDARRGSFRRDLYYRIAGVTCILPALAERPDDILPLVDHFIAQLRPDIVGRGVRLDEAVREYLLHRPYPGNVRDLRQLVARMLMRQTGQGSITVGSIPPDERPVGTEGRDAWRDDQFAESIRRALARGGGLKEIGRAATEMAIHIAVSEEPSLRSAARRLGVSERALQLRRADGRRGEPKHSSGGG